MGQSRPESLESSLTVGVKCLPGVSRGPASTDHLIQTVLFLRPQVGGDSRVRQSVAGNCGKPPALWVQQNGASSVFSAVGLLGLWAPVAQPEGICGSGWLCSLASWVPLSQHCGLSPAQRGLALGAPASPGTRGSLEPRGGGAAAPWCSVSLWWWSWKPPGQRGPQSPASLHALLLQTLWFDLQQHLSDEEGTNMVRTPPCGPVPFWARTQDADGSVSLTPTPTRHQHVASLPSQGCSLAWSDGISRR